MGAGPVALFNAPSPKKEENIIYIYIYQGPQKVQSAPKWQVCPVYNTRGHSGKQTNDRSEMSEGNSLKSMCIPPRCALLSCPSSGLPRPRNAPERSGTLRPGVFWRDGASPGRRNTARTCPENFEAADRTRGSPRAAVYFHVRFAASALGAEDGIDLIRFSCLPSLSLTDARGGGRRDRIGGHRGSYRPSEKV